MEGGESLISCSLLEAIQCCSSLHRKTHDLALIFRRFFFKRRTRFFLHLALIFGG